MKYSVLLILVILVELAASAFIFFDESWKDVGRCINVYLKFRFFFLLPFLIGYTNLSQQIPDDKTGDFDKISDFLEKNWKIARWVALGAIVLQVLVFLLALLVRAANQPPEYDSDDEYIGGPRQQRQPLINNRVPVPATGVPIAGTLDNRPSRNDAWSTRMREKYGLDTSEFTYNPSESNRNQQASPQQQTEEGSRCTIM
ncbi:hypothetical protein AgCh_016851 [Apium graveolens]